MVERKQARRNALLSAVFKGVGAFHGLYSLNRGCLKSGSNKNATRPR